MLACIPATLIFLFLYRMQILAITLFVAIIIASAQAVLPLTNKGCQCLSDCKICSSYHSVSAQVVVDSRWSTPCSDSSYLCTIIFTSKFFCRSCWVADLTGKQLGFVVSIRKPVMITNIEETAKWRTNAALGGTLSTIFMQELKIGVYAFPRESCESVKRKSHQNQT